MILLHQVGFPLLQLGAFVALPWGDQVRLGLLGALSSTGWLFAAFLGIARHWNHVLPYQQVTSIFATALLMATLVALTVVSGLRRLMNSRDGLLDSPNGLKILRPERI